MQQYFLPVKSDQYAIVVVNVQFLTGLSLFQAKPSITYRGGRQRLLQWRPRRHAAAARPAGCTQRLLVYCRLRVRASTTKSIIVHCVLYYSYSSILHSLLTPPPTVARLAHCGGIWYRNHPKIITCVSIEYHIPCQKKFELHCIFTIRILYQFCNVLTHILMLRPKN